MITLNPWCPSTKFSHYALNLNALRLHWCLRKEPFSLAKPRMKWTLFCSPKKRHPSPLTFSKMQYPSICRRSVNTPIINVFFCPISTILQHNVAKDFLDWSWYDSCWNRGKIACRLWWPSPCLICNFFFYKKHAINFLHTVYALYRMRILHLSTW